jgi:hypothetical protein
VEEREREREREREKGGGGGGGKELGIAVVLEMVAIVLRYIWRGVLLAVKRNIV